MISISGYEIRHVEEMKGKKMKIAETHWQVLIVILLCLYFGELIYICFGQLKFNLSLEETKNIYG